MRDSKNITPILWEMVEQGTIKKNSALYHWLNRDQGEVIFNNRDVFWIEKFGIYCEYPNDKAFKQLKGVMLKRFGAEWLYDKYPVEGD